MKQIPWPCCSSRRAGGRSQHRVSASSTSGRRTFTSARRLSWVAPKKWSMSPPVLRQRPTLKPRQGYRMRLRIEHRTRYLYDRSVEFGRHRLVIRPREGHDLRIESMKLQIEPAHSLMWVRDVFGNSIAIADF